MLQSKIYFPGLNGLRAIAALAVVVSHTTLSLKNFNLDPYLFGTFQDGNPKGLLLAGFGVSIFFVLSGFLITFLLQEEQEIQSINIKKFYARRILRIWPLYYLYLIIVLIIMIILNFKIDLQALLFYIFFASNIPFILSGTIPLLAHYWSIGVEEQFYLFWPWINKNIKKHLTSVILAVIFSLLGTKLFLHYFYPGSLLETIIQVTRFHCMMIGALGAILYKQKNITFLKITDNKIAQIICWVIITLIIINKFHIASVIDNEIVSVVAMIIIIGQIRIKHRVINLETRILDFLGKISYAIYVIHPVIIFLSPSILNQLNLEAPYNYLIIYLSILSITILLSLLSYHYFEKPFLKMKNKYVIVNSASAMPKWEGNNKNQTIKKN